MEDTLPFAGLGDPDLYEMVPEGSSDPKGMGIGNIFLSTEKAAQIFYYLLRGGTECWGEGQEIPSEICGALDLLSEIPFVPVAKDARIIMVHGADPTPPAAQVRHVYIENRAFSLEEVTEIACYFFRGGAEGWKDGDAPLPVRTALTMLLEVTYEKTETGWAKRHAGASDTPSLVN